MSRMPFELTRVLLGEAADDLVMIDARTQRHSWIVGCSLMGGGLPITQEKNKNSRKYRLCCRLCGDRLRMGDEVLERQCNHVQQHITDLGAERLTIFLALKAIQPAKSAVFSAFGFYPGTAEARGFWSQLREERRRGP